jgi:tRNA A37 threonylcarbamoyladenosine modification protein TsaB
MERASGAVSVLAIDTATRSRVVVAVATPAGEQIRGVVMSDDAVGTLLPRALSGLLPLVSAAVVVVIGPGTYTGVRAGMAGALGIAQALDLPLFGIGSLEVAAYSTVTPGCSPTPDAARSTSPDGARRRHRSGSMPRRSMLAEHPW